MNVRTEYGSPHPAVVDAAIEAYVCWREACTAARDAYRRWSSADTADRSLASAAYLAALDREEIAADAYAQAIGQLGDECVY